MNPSAPTPRHQSLAPESIKQFLYLHNRTEPDPGTRIGLPNPHFHSPAMRLSSRATVLAAPPGETPPLRLCDFLPAFDGFLPGSATPGPAAFLIAAATNSIVSNACACKVPSIIGSHILSPIPSSVSSRSCYQGALRRVRR